MAGEKTSVCDVEGTHSVYNCDNSEDVRMQETRRGFRSKFPGWFIQELDRWVCRQRRVGKIGEPCAPEPDRILQDGMQASEETVIDLHNAESYVT
jgi:hypothetical protein